MRIEFPHDKEWLFKTPKPRRTPAEIELDEARRYWTTVIRMLKEESGLPKYDDEFDAWLLDRWGIRILYEHKEVPLMITGMEIDDHMSLLLQLKYPQI